MEKSLLEKAVKTAKRLDLFEAMAVSVRQSFVDLLEKLEREGYEVWVHDDASVAVYGAKLSNADIYYNFHINYFPQDKKFSVELKKTFDENVLSGKTIFRDYANSVAELDNMIHDQIEKYLPQNTIIDLTEAKADQQKFIDKFGQTNFDRFNKVKSRLKNKDIYYWLKRSQFELESELYRLENTLSNTQKRKQAKSMGAELMAEDDNWYAYNILSYEGAVNYGAATSWCVASEDSQWTGLILLNDTSFTDIDILSSSEKKELMDYIYNYDDDIIQVDESSIWLDDNSITVDAEVKPEHYWHTYTENGDKIYFFIAKPENKECYDSYDDYKYAWSQKNAEYYDASDNELSFYDLPESLMEFIRAYSDNFPTRYGLFESMRLTESKQDTFI